ncbi:protein translocase subunit SecE [Saccharopolyspora subtropica]|uniref:Protein translocase subunit SecE n=1 Tax=Saccharopolyspora thermophila TaxID=89367 RepID=A0A917JZD8_9PSEU|nr:preprotein translocase subunit SecE [Saccharopolyspora subtropica]GGI93665.1 protein translocase subunit SecE [Saccharopolyspora subtropica]
MSEDREQEQDGARDNAARPSRAAARREHRASARPTGRRGRSGESGSGSARTTESKGRPTPSRDGRQGRVSLFRKIGRFLREVVAELRKVIWPTRRSLATYTLVVLVFVSVMVAFVAGVDVLFAKGVGWLFGSG